VNFTCGNRARVVVAPGGSVLKAEFQQSQLNPDALHRFRDFVASGGGGRSFPVVERGAVCSPLAGASRFARIFWKAAELSYCEPVQRPGSYEIR